MKTGARSDQPHRPLRSVTVIGCGRMGRAIVQGFVLAGVEHVHGVVRSHEKRTSLVAEGLDVHLELDPSWRSQLVIIAVKPYDLDPVIAMLNDLKIPGATIVSVAAGRSLAALRNDLDSTYAVFRARPNIFVRAGRGNWLLADEHDYKPEALEEVARYCGLTGRVFSMSETRMAQLTWDSSTMPGVIVSTMIRDRLAQSAEDGTPPDLLERVLLSGFEGFLAECTRQVEAGASLGEALDDIVDNIVSKGGLNDTAIEYLRTRDFWNTLREGRRAYLGRE